MSRIRFFEETSSQSATSAVRKKRGTSAVRSVAKTRTVQSVEDVDYVEGEDIQEGARSRRRAHAGHKRNHPYIKSIIAGVIAAILVWGAVAVVAWNIISAQLS